MTRPEKIAAAVLVLLLGGLAGFGYIAWRCVHVTIPDAYAVWNTADLVIDYMDAHDGTWPHGWDDLRKTFATWRRPNPRQIDDYQARVAVDWHAAPKVLAAAPEPHNDQPPFRVIWLKDGNDTHWQGREPNYLIWRYLQDRAASTQPAATGP